MTTDQLMAKIKYDTTGHEDIWECSFEEFVAKVTPELNKRHSEAKLTKEELSAAISILKSMYFNKELKGTISNEVSKAIDYAMVYVTNVLGH